MKRLTFAFLAALIAALLMFAFAASAGILGDFDGNDNVTSDDAVYLLRYTLFPEYYPVTDFADFDHNDNITSDDAVYLLRYTLFPEYYPLIGGACEHPAESVVTDPAVEPTCTEPGLTEGSHCDKCGEVIAEQKVISALGHDWNDDGICTRCGEEKPSEGLKYELNSDGTTYTVTGLGECTDTKIVIPKEYNGLPVTEIGIDAFSQTDIERIVIPEGVVTINEYAFWKCESLASVVLPASLHTIGKEAFKACDNLLSAVFSDPDGWEGFKSGVLSNAISAAVKLKSDLGVWIHHIWSAPEELTELTCTQNGCYRHTCTVCGKVENYYVYATGHDFDENDVCKKCGEHYTPTDESYFEFSRLDDGTYSIKPKSVSNLPSHVILPKTHNGKPVTSIVNDAFKDCGRLTSVIIPDSVTSIGYMAFYGCSSLTSITIPDSVTSIGDYAFRNCSSLTSITIPDSVTSIPYCAFYGCSSLTSVTIPDSVTSIGVYAFSGCSGLTSITIPDSVTSIGQGAFEYCSGLTSVTIPDGVTSIGDYAFLDCSRLTSIKVDKNNSVYHSNGNCLIETKAKTLVLGCSNSVIPNDGSVTSIGLGAFSVCSGLTSIIIPDSVTSIGYEAFGGCSSLKSITIPDSVTSIGSFAFYGSTDLTEINFTGTKAQWYSISKGYNWNYNTGSYVIHCTDGDIAK